MDYGVYVDMVVCDGENCLDLLRNIVILFDEFKYCFLKCMVVFVIGKFKIFYEGIILFILNFFVGLYY